MSEQKPRKTREHFLENDRRKTWTIEKIFENFLWSSRYLVLFAVISSLLASFILFAIGTFDIVKLIIDLVNAACGQGAKIDLHGAVLGTIVGSIDIFLIAVVSLIFSFGLYELFISHIDAADSTESSNILDIGSLDVLKDKIGQVIIMALIVKFFQFMLEMKIENIVQMLYFAASVGILALALFLLHLGKKMSHHSE
ncbi:MAG: YqhA family protein [Victivallaceae bacterium]|jgi:uncharacterized membrane protein YqhA